MTVWSLFPKHTKYFDPSQSSFMVNYIVDDLDRMLQALRDTGAQVEDRRNLRKVVAASFIGTTIEWYDFFLYGTATALVFNCLFFPEFDPAIGTLAALGTFAAGYLARPIGAAILGHFGDTRGRKSMLFLTLIIMGSATFLIGALPTYAQLGALAPVLLVGLRVLQGVGLGGEWGAAVLMAVSTPRRTDAVFMGAGRRWGRRPACCWRRSSFWVPQRCPRISSSAGAGGCRSCSA